MKKTISLLLAFLLVFSCFAFHSPDASALDDVWIKEFYKDKFGDKTEEYYLTNKDPFKGTYNSDSVNDGELGANLFFERDGENLLAYLSLFLDGTNQVKYGTSSGEKYLISVKRVDGSQFDTSGNMQEGENRIQINTPVELLNALRASNGIVKIYVEESNNKNNNYLFAVECGNFDELFTQEIFIPYQEAKYQHAENLLKNNQLDEAVIIFRELSGYRDSAQKVEEIEKYRNQEEIKSDTGVPLNICAEWEISKKTTDSIDLIINVYVECYSLYTWISNDSLSVSANGQTASLATPAIEYPPSKDLKLNKILLNTHTFQINDKDIENGIIPVKISWAYNGTYAGKFIDVIECDGNINAMMTALMSAQQKQEIAREYVDKPLSELIDKIGEPLFAEYVTSCLIPGAEDGELHYDGFSVYTVKDEDSETVLDVQN